MKHICFFVAICLYINIKSLGASISLKDSLNEDGRLIKQGEFLLGKELYSWEYKALEGKKFRFIIKKGDVAKFTEFSQLDYPIFREIFNNCVGLLDANKKDQTVTYEEAAKVFITLKTAIDTEIADFAPKAGFIAVSRAPVNVYIYEDKLKLLRSNLENEKKKLSKLTRDINQYKSQLLLIAEDNIVRKPATVVKDTIVSGILYKGTSSNNPTLPSDYKPYLEQKITQTDEKIKDVNSNIFSINGEIDVLSKNTKNTKKNRSIKTVLLKGTFVADSARMEFFEGNIKNLFIFGNVSYNLDSTINVTNGLTNEKKPIVFRNFNPIPFSSLTDYTSRNNLLWQFPSSKDNIFNLSSSADQFITSYNIIKYDPLFANNQEDYSPRDGVQVFKAGTKLTVYKEVNSKLFKVKVFSDFIGVKDDNPNGLIQFELSKRIILNPRREQISFINKSRYPDLGFGLFNYIEPTFVMSKIEENNKILITDKLKFNECQCTAGSSIKSVINLLDLYKYQNFSAGGALNILVFDNPNYKTSFYFNAGLKLFRTSIRDTLRTWKDNNIINTNRVENYNISTLQLYPEFIYQVKPDSRFGFSLTLRGLYLLPQTDRLTIMNNYNHIESEQKRGQNLILNTQLDVFIRPDPDQSTKGEIFARLAYSNLLLSGNTNFMQVQVGYSFNILKKD
ncbi:hypothetical protein [Spirosoma sp. KNUC1025]|uniref:hypothetical protein n=1 Tax=Spirosoma sp. KNUC1025 TaxID=2894082 RepID=UPI00386A62FB|nr:hypothetical protein LN737_05135 [Spirosoma sp. KNUC1025]